MGYLRIVFFVCISGGIWAQDALNMSLLGNWNDPDLIIFGGQKYSDCWAYAADGREYAIMGSMRKVHFLDITDPTDIVEVAALESSNVATSYWRDFKTYGHYAYGVADMPGSVEGLMIFDLSDLPNSVTVVNEITSGFQRAHNIFIDTLHGRLYAAGTNTRSNGLIVYDLTDDPVNPEIIGDVQLLGGYVHDVHVRDHLAYCSQGTSSGLRVHDMTNPQLPNQLGFLSGYVDAGYNHSSWLTEDGTHLAMCDENFNRTVKMANVEDFTDMFVTDTFRSALLAPDFTNSIAHNPFIHGDYLYVAYYHDGLQIFDISDPENVFRVAYYDTYPDNTNYSGFFGAWGTYPFLSSGNIVVSDMVYGLFVLQLEDIFLPVDLTRFEARKVQDGIEISWRAENEEHLQYYELQRVNGNGVIPLSTVTAAEYHKKKGSYLYVDKDPEAGVNYYRLKSVANDGTETLSGIISQRWSHEIIGAYKVYPTILSSQTQQEITIEANQNHTGMTTISLIDMNGKSILKDRLMLEERTSASITVPGSLPAGWYFLSLQKEGSLEKDQYRVLVK